MSRQITIKTEMKNESILESALKDFNAVYSKSGTRYVIQSADGYNLSGYRPCDVDVATGRASYDEDYLSQKTFVQNALFQMYNKHLVLDTMAMEGHRVDDIFTAQDSFVSGLEDVVEQGDILIYGAASTF